jgi:hypothetical protein
MVQVVLDHQTQVAVEVVLETIAAQTQDGKMVEMADQESSFFAGHKFRNI